MRWPFKTLAKAERSHANPRDQAIAALVKAIAKTNITGVRHLP